MPEVASASRVRGEVRDLANAGNIIPSSRFVFEIFGGKDNMRSFLTGQSQAFAVLALLYGGVLAALVIIWVVREVPIGIRIPTDVLMFCVVGWVQYSICNGMHEAVHYNLRNRDGDFLASLLTAWPIGLTMGYRGTHLAHHRFMGTARDPDYPMYTCFPASRLALASRLVWYVSGIPALIQFLGLLGLRGDRLDPSIMTRTGAGLSGLAGFIAMQFFIAGLFWLVFGSPVDYVVFWCLPIATVGKLLSSTRLLCEHGSPERDWVVRTIHAPRWRTWILGAFDFNYHGEHHLFPYVPFAGLRRVHDLHAAYLMTPHPDHPLVDRIEIYEGGYVSLLMRWFRDLPWVKEKRA